MSNTKIEFEIPEEEIKDSVLNVLAKEYTKNFSYSRRQVDNVVAECVRKIIYDDKERIIEMIVARAARECGNKAVKKIIESTLKD